MSEQVSIYYWYSCVEVIVKSSYTNEIVFDNTETFAIGYTFQSEAHLLCKIGSKGYRLHTRTQTLDQNNLVCKIHYVFELVCTKGKLNVPN